MIKLACASLCFDGFGDNDFVKTFDMAPKVGYEYIEFNCWHPSTLTPGKIRDIKERCKISGLKPAVLHVAHFGGSNFFDVSKDVCHKIRAIEAARELGCKRVSATANARGTNGGLDAIIACLKEVAPVAEENDVFISLENHCNNNLENISDYQAIFEKITSKNVGICLDTGHFDAANVNMDDLIDIFQNRISHIHLKENKGMGVKEFTRFGEGTTDNDHVIERMIHIGYEGFLTIEVSPEIGEHDTRPFGFEDVSIPYHMFKKYEIK